MPEIAVRAWTPWEPVDLHRPLQAYNALVARQRAAVTAFLGRAPDQMTSELDRTTGRVRLGFVWWREGR